VVEPGITAIGRYLRFVIELVSKSSSNYLGIYLSQIIIRVLLPLETQNLPWIEFKVLDCFSFNKPCDSFLFLSFIEYPKAAS